MNEERNRICRKDGEGGGREGRVAVSGNCSVVVRELEDGREEEEGPHWESIIANCMQGPVGPCKMPVAMKNERTPTALALEMPINNL